ncbi:MAG: hypothetical protein V2A56_01110 [bacterium]
MTNGLLVRDVWRESLAVATRAGVSWYKRPFFAWRVVRRWKRHNSLENAINDALSAYVWDHLK